VYVDAICPGVCKIKIISLQANMYLYNNRKGKEESNPAPGEVTGWYCSELMHYLQRHSLKPSDNG
jgi:hypothetical protein